MRWLLITLLLVLSCNILLWHQHQPVSAWIILPNKNNQPLLLLPVHGYRRRRRRHRRRRRRPPPPRAAGVLLLAGSRNQQEQQEQQQQQQQQQQEESNGDDRIIHIPEPSFKEKAFEQQTPHSGRHFHPSHPAYNCNTKRRNWLSRRRRRFRRQRQKRVTEGWYYRLTIPPSNDEDEDDKVSGASFAFIISVEDPISPPSSPLSLVCIQVIGPNDDYIVQYDNDTAKFWAWKHQQGLGCNFEYNNSSIDEIDTTTTTTTALTSEAWKDRVESGFQILPKHFMGRIRGVDGSSTAGPLSGGSIQLDGLIGCGDSASNNNNDCTCDFDFTIDQVIAGWGSSSGSGGGGGSSSNTGEDDNSSQSAQQHQHQSLRTGGWLSRFAVFEPHWQVTLADARVSGTVRWKNKTYSFSRAHFYAEKNWGAALPTKWYWTQCNSFIGYGGGSSSKSKPPLSVTAGGGIRTVGIGPILQHQETLGMLCVHYNNTFYQGVPWTGSTKWNVSTWGSWELYGNSTTSFGDGDSDSDDSSQNPPFEAYLSYKCDPTTTPGLVFRAPTPDRGMVYFCRDTFVANVSLTLYELEYCPKSKTYQRILPPIIDHATSQQGGAEIGGGPWCGEWIVVSQVKQPILSLLRLPYRIESLLVSPLKRWRRRRR